MPSDYRPRWRLLENSERRLGSATVPQRVMEVIEEVVADDGTVLRYDGSGVPEVEPPRFERDDAEGIRESLRVHGFSTIKEAMLPHEVEEGRRLLWQFLEGNEQPLMTQTRPVGWKQGQPTTWIEGHGDHLISCTAHCDSMWHCRTCPGVIQGFATAIGTPDLTHAFDRMSINLPTSSGNPVTMERAAQSYDHGKFGVMQSMHTHKNGYYDKLNESQTGEKEYTDFYGIVPLWDMNKATGATAVVPGSHKLVPEINAFRKSRKDADGKYIGPAVSEAADVECFTANGLTPCVSCIRAGDLVIFDTAMFHGGCSAEDPSGISAKQGPDELLRAIYILGMTPTRLKTAEELHARRLAYELDLNWYPDSNHQRMVERVFEEHTSTGGTTANVREFEDATEEQKRLIDPTWRKAAKL